MTEATIIKPATKGPRRMAREPQPQGAAPAAVVTPAITADADTPAAAAKAPSKTSLILDLLGRTEGATLDQLVAATGWLPHTARAMLTGLKKKGHIIVSEKPAEGPRIYRAAGKAEAG